MSSTPTNPRLPEPGRESGTQPRQTQRAQQTQQAHNDEWIAFFDGLKRARGIQYDQDAARRIGLSKSAIVHWREHHWRPSLDACLAVARAFGVPKLLVLLKAGLIEERDLMLRTTPTGDRQLVRITDPDGKEGTIPVPETLDAVGARAAFEQAVLAIHRLPIGESAKWAIIGTMEAHIAAAGIASTAEGGRA